MRPAASACALALVVAGARFSHLDLLWIEEAYPMAAAAEILRGKVLYRDIWFDKPPFYALFYLLCGASAGWALRLVSSAYILAGCWTAWRFFPSSENRAQQKWEGLTAACLLGFYLTFDIPSSVMALAPDLLSVPLHLAAVFLAMRGKAFVPGLLCGLTMLVNTKAVFVLAACLLWAPRAATIAGAALPNAIALAVLASWGALGAYWEQVWLWGVRYSADTFLAEPWKEALSRTANWFGFHIAIVAGAIVYLARERSWRVAAWIALSFAAVCAGSRFFPRYYFLLLPPMLFAGVRGLLLLQPRWRALLLCTLLIPAIRFGPRYVKLAAGDWAWTDLALMQDSREAAAIARHAAKPGDTLLVWGYRPDIYVFSGLPAATKYLDSQPLNGVLADRHLTSSKPTMPDIAARNLRELAVSPGPSIVVDGLGPLNPELKFRSEDYQVAGRTRLSIVYVSKR